MTKLPPTTLAKILRNLTRPIPAPYRPPPPPPKPPKPPKATKRKAKKVLDTIEGSE